MIRLLIVDDELPICDFLREFFIKKNYTVFFTAKAKDVMPLVKKERPHIVLLDIKMADISGIEILRRIKENDNGIKVIMLTAVDDEAMIKLAREYGASDYVTKPFTLDRLERDILPKVIKELP